MLNEYHRNVSDDELLGDIRRIAERLGKTTITIKEYLDNGGKYHWSTFHRRYGSWIVALQKCGLSPNDAQRNIRGIPDETLLEDIRFVAQTLQKNTINSSEYSTFGHYSHDVIIRKFGSWNSALATAGLVPFDHPLGGGTKNKISELECVEEIERIWTKLGRQPTTTDIRSGISRFSLHVFERRFGSWRKALEYFVDYMNGNQIDECTETNTGNNFTINEQRTNTQEVVHKTKREIGLRTRFLVMKRDSFKCQMCGRSPATTPGLELHVDHIVPWSKGGETSIDNLQTLCSDCNLGKSNFLEQE